MSDRIQELEYSVRCWKRLALGLAGALALALLVAVTFLALYLHQQRVAEELQRPDEENFRVATDTADQMLGSPARRSHSGDRRP